MPFVPPRASRRYGLVGGVDAFALEIGECFAGFGQLLEQGRGLPDRAVLTVEFGDAIVDFLQPDGACVPHRAAAKRREAVAIHVDRVDIACAQRVAFLEDARAFIDQE